MIFPTTTSSYVSSSNSNDENYTRLYYKYDFNAKQHVIVDGNFVECTQLESIQHFIQVLLRTPINKYDVYTVDEVDYYGLSIHNLIGTKIAPQGFYYAECQREITEQLLKLYEITSVTNFTFNQESTHLRITFDVYVNNSILHINEVISIEL